MKELNITAEMQKFQDAARRSYAERKVLDLDAVMIGWKLDAGRILHTPGKATIELLEKPAPHITKAVKINLNGKDCETSIDTIARIIVTDQVGVYYSK